MAVITKERIKKCLYFDEKRIASDGWLDVHLSHTVSDDSTDYFPLPPDKKKSRYTLEWSIEYVYREEDEKLARADAIDAIHDALYGDILYKLMGIKHSINRADKKVTETAVDELIKMLEK